MRQRLGLLFLFLLVGKVVFAEGTLVLLKPTGEKQNNLEVFQKIKASDPLYFKARNKFTRGFMAESIYLHGILQNYLLDKGKIKEKYPLYLALTDHKIGKACKGLIIQEEDKKTVLNEAWYVDLPRGVLEQNPADLGSYHQILPYEIGHVLVGLILGEPEVLSPKIHYFCTQTDPRLSFIEGFAESFQYVAIITEKDPRLKRSIQENVRYLGLSFTRELHAFRREFSWPGRLGFYRATMPKWYQDLENYRRYNFIESKLIQRPARLIETSDPWLQRLYLDAGVWPDIRRYRSLENAVSTEGVMAAFFGFLVQSDLKKNYYPPEYYRSFFPIDAQFVFEQEIYPLRNQFLKIFIVLDKYVNLNHASIPPIVQFIEGYIREFPPEEEIVKAIWKEASGIDYSLKTSQEFWVVNSQARFVPWVMASLGPKEENYLFNLNSADSTDLVCLKGFNPKDAPVWLEARNAIGGFLSLEEATSVQGISPESAKALKTLKLLDSVPQNPMKNLSYSALILYPLLHFLKIGFVWFLFLAIMYLSASKILHTPWKFSNLLLNFLLFYVYILIAAAVTFVFDKNILVISIIALVVILFRLYQGYRSKAFNWPSIIITLSMAGVLAYSLY